ncbi:hypothetical protein [Bradyrhizobium sp. Y-H1]|jgi:hypothetical protein|uniref:hypothetical protein n=2 Tax=unclassified Bradyrhizobium TaxID=2631580 RepID=UPI001050FDD1|nr:hypothetical protein [Bradyrhizobium sp. Y-H1]
MAEYANERLDRLLGRLYTLWVVAIIFGALNLRLEKVQAGGFEFTLKDPDVVQGVLFLVCLLHYVAIVALMIMFASQYRFPNRHISRRAIFAALGTRTTLLNRSRAQIIAVKKIAKAVYAAAALFMFVVLFLPLVHILVFQREQLLKGLFLVF